MRKLSGLLKDGKEPRGGRGGAQNSRRIEDRRILHVNLITDINVTIIAYKL